MGSVDHEQQWRALFIESQQGDKKAYHELLLGISSYVKSSVKRSFSNEQMAEDVVQEVLIALHKAKHTYDPDKAFKPWLGAIIRFKVIDHLRKSYRRRDREVFLSSDETFANYATNVDFDTGLDLEKMLNTLPKKQRVAFELLKVDGLSVREAAAHTGWSESNIKVSAHRAYKLLRKAILSEGG